jgi:hypothetical protein
MLTRLVLIVETHDQPGGAPAGHLPPPVQPRPQRAHAGIGSGLLHPGTHANVSPVHVAPSVVGPLRPPAHHAVPTAREIPAFVTAKTRRVLPDTLRPVTARPRRRCLGGTVVTFQARLLWNDIRRALGGKDRTDLRLWGLDHDRRSWAGMWGSGWDSAHLLSATLAAA